MLEAAPPPILTPEEEAARALQRYQASQTFLLKTADPRVMLLRYVTIGLLIAFLFGGVPFLAAAGAVPIYKVSILGKYLCFAICALGVDLIWGYTGLMTLCQALFFCIGGYAMAMFLSLKAGGGDVRPEYNDIPQFMFFNSLRALPWFWKPFSSFLFAVAASLILPALVAALFGFLVLRNRVRGVYFSIITQALAQAAWFLMCLNKMLMGGTNGLTNFNKALTQSRSWIISLYLLTLVVLTLGYLLCWGLIRSRLGRILVAVRDKEMRLYFAGYKPHLYKIFAFSAGALLAGAGGMLYPAQTGIITPQVMDVQASIIMVVGVALGGRGKLWGAVFGAILLNGLFTALSSDFALVWNLVLGATAIGVVLFLPEGIAGIWARLEKQIASGASFLRATLTAVPIFAVAIFVLVEALGLFPEFLQRTYVFSVGPMKYELLVFILAAAGITDYILTQSEQNPARGFSVTMAEPKTASGGTA